MAYSAVTQPVPLPSKNPGTFSSTDAVQITWVSPQAMSAEPSACRLQSGVMTMTRSSSVLRPSGRMGASLYRRRAARQRRQRLSTADGDHENVGDHTCRRAAPAVRAAKRLGIEELQRHALSWKYPQPTSFL